TPRGCGCAVGVTLGASRSAMAAVIVVGHGGNTRAMYAQDESQQRTELRLAFLRHLPARIEQVARRANRFCRDGWDVNGLSLLQQDVQRLAGASGRYGMVDASERLHALEMLLAEMLERGALPDEDANRHVAALLQELAPASAAPAPVAAAAAQP